MSDETLREAERVQHEDPAAAARLIAQRLRAGTLTRDRAELAAVLGHQPTRAALGLPPVHAPGCGLQSAGGSPPKPEHAPGDLCSELCLVEFVSRMVRFSPYVGVRFGHEVALLVAKALHFEQADEPFWACERTGCRPRKYALARIAEWIDGADMPLLPERARLLRTVAAQAEQAAVSCGPGNRWITTLGLAVAAFEQAGECRPVSVAVASAEHFLLEAVQDGLDYSTGPHCPSVAFHRATDALLTWVLR